MITKPKQPHRILPHRKKIPDRSVTPFGIFFLLTSPYGVIYNGSIRISPYGLLLFASIKLV